MEVSQKYGPTTPRDQDLESPITGMIGERPSALIRRIIMMVPEPLDNASDGRQMGLSS
jgi:hypothetical protein